MSSFEEDDFFNEDDPQEYPEDYQEGQSGVVGASIPAELMNRWKQAEIDLDMQKINLDILEQVTNLLSKSWLWRFRSQKSKIRLICDSYHTIQDLVKTEP